MSNIIEIDFGRVSWYDEDKGFGFVSNAIQSQFDDDIFFHIKTIKMSHPDIAKQLDDGGFIDDSDCDRTKNSPDAICFWYRVEKTNKGLQVKSVINIGDLNDDEIISVRKKIEKNWQDQKNISNCLTHVTEDLLGVDRTNQLKNIRKDREKTQSDRKIEELKKYLKSLKEEIALCEKGHEERGLLLLEIKLTTIELEGLNGSDRLREEEYKQLIKEMKPLGFTNSNEISHYIMENNLGEKYKNISGIVKMEQDGSTWDFDGGFPKNIYRKICVDLGLDKARTTANAVGFESYNDLNNK